MYFRIYVESSDLSPWIPSYPEKSYVLGQLDFWWWNEHKYVCVRLTPVSRHIWTSWPVLNFSVGQADWPDSSAEHFNKFGHFEQCHVWRVGIFLPGGKLANVRYQNSKNIILYNFAALKIQWGISWVLCSLAYFGISCITSKHARGGTGHH